MSIQKVALIVPNNVWFSPYVFIYLEVLKAHHLDYDIISWNRDGKEEDAIQFNYKPKSRNPLIVIWSYWKFALFVKKIIKKNGYERLIVFTPQSGIFLSSFLKKEFKGRYIFDYRDLSIEQKSYFKRPFSTVLRNSYANVISSPGFKNYLPTQFNYYISHNFEVASVRKALASEFEMVVNTNPIDVLTIGGIRDYESNVQILDHLANHEGFYVRFVGKGNASVLLEKRANELKAKNVSFEGYYPKEKEKDYISETTFMNIYYPRKPSHDSALSNRFYNSLICKKPMITTKDTIQGYYAEKYHVGLALDDCNGLQTKLNDFLSSLDKNSYSKECNSLLKSFLIDYEKWESMLYSFFNLS